MLLRQLHTTTNTIHHVHTTRHVHARAINPAATDPIGTTKRSEKEICVEWWGARDRKRTHSAAR